jgi:hypothetical protein
MSFLILAAEAAVDFPGDDFMIVALVSAGLAMLFAAIATVMVTPGRDSHDDH